MNLSRRIADALAKRENLQGPLEAQEGPHRLVLDVLVSSPVGAEATALNFWAIRTESPERTLDELKSWADRVAAQVTYLMEPLVVLEADPLGVEVEIRSQSPTPREGMRNYFEARLDRSGHLKITRQAYDESARLRRAIPFQITREVLERLAADLVATAG